MSHRLGIDFGTTHTVAVLETPDGRAQPLLFDSSPLLSSAVYADTDGRLLTGRDGVRNAGLDPTRYEPNPKRRIDEAAVLLGTEEFPVQRLVAAVLGRVAAEAIRAAGEAPAQTVLTYPADWGSRRKDILAQAAAAAGLGAVTLVPEPVAAAAHFTGVLGRTVHPGQALAVYDFGAGTFDASLVRRRPDGAWELAAVEGLTDVGGLDLDAALVQRIAQTVAPHGPQHWQRLMNPRDGADRRAARAFWEDVRNAKEQLSRTASAAVHVPLFNMDTHLTREEFEAAARPLLTRTVEVMAALVARAGAAQLAGLYLVGGSSRIPVIATMLHQRLGVAPTLIDQPELLVAQGSLRAVAPPSPAAAPFGAGYSAAGPVTSAPPGPFPPTLSGPTFPPVGMPVSAAPTSGPGNDPYATGQVSAPPVGSVSGAPYPPGQPPAAMPAPGVPMWASTMPQQRPAGPGGRRRRSGRLPVILAAAAVVLIVLCGIGLKTVSGVFDDDDGKNNTSGDRNAPPGDSNADPGGGLPDGGDDGPAAGSAQKLDVKQTVWYAGMKITVNSATYDPTDEREPLKMDVAMENIGAKSINFANLTVTFALDGSVTTGRVEEIGDVPGGTTVKGTFVFQPDKPIRNLKTGVVSIGRSEAVQGVVTLGDAKKLVSNEPKKVAGPTDEQRAGVLGFKVTQCEQRADFPFEHDQADKGSYFVVCVFDVKSYKQSIYDHGVWDSNLRLKLPDGTVVAPEKFGNALLNQQEQARDLPVSFSIRWPAPGAYVFQLFDAGRLGNENQPGPGNLVEVPMTLG
jgi:hypothetical protein